MQVYYRNKAFLFLMILSCVFVQAQDITDFDVIPKPYLGKPYYDNKTNAGISEVIYVTKSNKWQHLINDTIFIAKYDPQGRRVEYLRFENNKRNEPYLSSYPKNQYRWEQDNKARKMKDVCVSTYNSKGEYKKIYSYTLKSNDTLNRQTRTYLYDKKGRLIKTVNLFDDRMGLNSEYDYTDDNLSVLRQYSTSNRHNYTQYEYQFSEDGLLREMQEFQLRDTLKDFVDKQTFEYDNHKRLSVEKYKIGLPAFDVQTYYSYNENDNLQNMKIYWGKDTIAVDYKYNERCMMIEKKIYTTTWKSTKEIFFLTPMDSLTPMPYTFTEIYTYDDKDNLIGLKKMDKDGVFIDRVFILKYY
ncbi:MAG: hypothetical protein CFE23_04675 [Flavobacterium sp. BFFFF1]|nr:MAG: hypothetical protein CFE23_04675 [Flavobacterium sp. BFFFF1]